LLPFKGRFWHTDKNRFQTKEVCFMAKKDKSAKAEPKKEEAAEEKKESDSEDEGNIFEDSGDEEEF